MKTLYSYLKRCGFLIMYFGFKQLNIFHFRENEYGQDFNRNREGESLISRSLFTLALTMKISIYLTFHSTFKLLCEYLIFILIHFIISEKIHYIDFIISSQDLNICIRNVSIKLIVLQYLLLTVMIEYIILDFSKHCFKFWL